MVSIGQRPGAIKPGFIVGWPELTGGSQVGSQITETFTSPSAVKTLATPHRFMGQVLSNSFGLQRQVYTLYMYIYCDVWYITIYTCYI